MKKLIGFLVWIMVFIVSACHNNSKQAKNYNLLLDTASVSFIKQGLEAGQTEIKASEVAAANSKNPRVVTLAKMIISDHTLAGDELQKIAIANRVRGGDSLSIQHQKIITGIAALTGTKLDKAYIQMMVTDHQNAINLFTTATTDKIDDIQRFARKTLPVLKTHLDSAVAISGTLK